MGWITSKLCLLEVKAFSRRVGAGRTRPGTGWKGSHDAQILSLCEGGFQTRPYGRRRSAFCCRRALILEKNIHFRRPHLTMV